MIWKIAGAYITVIFFSGLVGVPRRYLIYAGSVGAVGWLVYPISADKGLSSVMSSFTASLAVAFLSHIYARIFRTPVTIFLIAGILPLVLGAGMYRIAFYIMADDSAMTAYYTSETVKIAGMIALAIFVMDSVFRVIQEKKWRKIR